jgi:Integrase core domain
MPHVEVFFALADVREKLENWRQDYNQVPPHSALADRAPEVFAKAWRQALSSASERTAGPADQVLAGALPGPEASDPKLTPLFGSPPTDAKGEAEKPVTEAAEQAPPK